MAHLGSGEAAGTESGLDVAQIARLVWEGRATVAIVTTIMLLLTVLYLHLQAFSYSATMTLVPTQGQTQGSGIASQLGGLAAMAGINLPSTQATSPFIVYTDALATRDVADEVNRRDPKVLQRLFKYEWNAEAGRFEEPASLRHAIASVVKPMLGLPVTQWSPPGGADLQAYIALSVKSAVDPKRPVISLTYFNPDPKFAAYFLQLVHQATDTVLRRMTLDRSSKYAKYLENKLNTTQNADLKQILVQSLSQQETLVMMSSSNTFFAAQPLGAPVVSLFPVQPRGSFILLAGAIAGLAFGCWLAVKRVSVPALWRDGSRTWKHLRLQS